MKSKREVLAGLLAVLAAALAVVGVLLGSQISKKLKYEEQLSLGEKYLAELDYESAEICFKKAIFIQEKKAAPYLQLAAVYVYQGRLGEAADILNEGAGKVSSTEEREQLQENLQKIAPDADQGKDKDSGDDKEKPDKGGEDKDKEAALLKEEAATDGSAFVCYQGNWYYRQYSAEDFEPSALFGEYPSVKGQPKEMVRLKPEGEQEVIFSDNGAGDIYIVKDRMILTDNENTWDVSAYAADLEGNEVRRFESSYPVASDRERGLVFFMNVQRGFFSWNVETDEVQRFEEDGTNNNFYQGKGEKNVYYAARQESGDVVLWAIDLDSMEKRQLAVFEDEATPDGFVTEGFSVIDVQELGDEAFVLTGGYAGTGNFFQGGKLYCVKLDGSGKEQLAGGSGGDCGEYFLAAEEEGQTVVYYTDYTETENNAKRLALGGAEEAADLTPWKRGEYFCDGQGGVSIYADTSGQAKQLLTREELSAELYADQMNEQGETLSRVTELSSCGGQTLYSVESSSHDSSGDRGWRYNYRREITRIYLLEEETREKTLLYEY